MNASAAIRFGRFELHPARQQLTTAGQPIAIGSRAMELLQALIARRDRTVSKDELLDLVWPGVIVEEANLHVHVSALRKVLGAQAIATVPGRGYRFVVPIENDPVADQAALAPPRERSLPEPASPLIGREAELDALDELVPGHRLVTLTGAGGIGKTRLALAVAARLASRWSDGVAWVDAASVRDPAALADAAARSLGVSLEGAGPPAERLAAAVARRSLLLLVDNCEHLLEATVALVRALRRTAPGIGLLITSQEALRLPDEQVFQLAPLGLPGPNDVADERFGAVRLFVERARAVDRAFVLEAANAAVVGAICRELDGLPLAIELAAARVKLLGVHGLHERLGRRLRLLTGGARDAMPRHRALQAALEWSHSLLDATEQTVLRRLGVFVGGFTLELAEAVSTDDADGPIDSWTLLEVLGSLVDKSLVGVDSGEPPRYRMLETMRLFALERLAEAGETARLRERHARAVADLYVRVDDERWGDGRTIGTREVTRRLQPEIDNARAALAWALDVGERPLAIALAGAAAAIFVQAGLIRELLPTMRGLLPFVDEATPSAQVNLLWRLGTVGIQDGMSHEELHRIKQGALDRARAAGFRRRLQTVLAALGFTLARRGEVEATEAVVAELETLERPDDPAYVRALRLTVEMMLHEHRQDLARVIASLGRQRTILHEAPDEVLPLLTCESNLVVYLSSIGRHEEAAELGLTLLARPDLPRTFVHAPCNTAYALAALGRREEALSILRQRRRDLAGTPIAVYSGEALAMLCLAGGRISDAVRIDAALDRQIQRAGRKVHPLTRAFRARLKDAVEAAGTSAADLHRWRDEGAVLSDEAAVELALR